MKNGRTDTKGGSVRKWHSFFVKHPMLPIILLLSLILRKAAVSVSSSRPRVCEVSLVQNTGLKIGALLLHDITSSERKERERQTMTEKKSQRGKIPRWVYRDAWTRLSRWDKRKREAWRSTALTIPFRGGLSLLWWNLESRRHLISSSDEHSISLNPYLRQHAARRFTSISANTWPEKCHSACRPAFIYLLDLIRTSSGKLIQWRS